MSGSTTARGGVALAAGAPLEAVLAAVAAEIGGPAFRVDGRTVDPVDIGGSTEPAGRPVTQLGIELLGQVYENLLASDDRRRRGAFFTPPEVADGLVGEVLSADGVPMGVVVDPACGAGAFLLAAGRRLVDLEAGVPATVAGNRLFGADIDPLAVAVCRWSIAAWAGIGPDEVAGVVVGDPLRSGPSLWEDRPVGGFDAVVGNPPFLGQLRRGTARSAADREVLRSVLCDLVRPYTDTAWLFLAAGVDLLAPGGRLALIQPQSVLAARDAAPVRAHVLAAGRLAGLWFDRSGVFAGRTEVCAPIVERRSGGGPVRLLVDRQVEPAGSASAPGPGEPWGAVVAELVGIPAVGVADVRQAGTQSVGDLASVTAGFRQHFYGLVPGTTERAVGPAGGRPLVTTGLVDPLRCRWSERPARFAGRRWEAPVVDEAAVAAADPSVGAWLADRHRPKLLVATQTRVVEVVVDETGEMVPVTPLVVIEPEPDDLWLLAAALSAPSVTALAARLTIGTAWSADRIKLTAGQVADLRLPADEEAWCEGAGRARDLCEAGGGATAGAWMAFGSVMCVAYGVPEEPLLAWWWARHPAH